MPRRSGQRRPPQQKKPALTHFLCLPLVTAASRPQLEASIKSFREDVTSAQPKQTLEPTLSSDGSPTSSTTAVAQVHPKAIRPVGALHCTLGVMSLSQEQLTQAINLLKSINIEKLVIDAFPEANNTSNDKEKPIGTEHATNQPASLNRPISPPAQLNPPPTTQSLPIQVDLRGLVSMHAPQNTSILYTAPQDHSQRLYRFCLALQAAFKAQGLLIPDDRKLKLHATLVNTIYAKGKKNPQPKSNQSQSSGAESSALSATGKSTNDEDRSEGHGPNANAPLKMDARGLLKKYKDFVWAENVVLDRIAICEMGTKKKMDDQGNIIAEEYTEVASVPF